MTQGNIGFEKVRRTRKIDTEDGKKDIVALPKRVKRVKYSEEMAEALYPTRGLNKHKPYG